MKRLQGVHATDRFLWWLYAILTALMTVLFVMAPSPMGLILVGLQGGLWALTDLVFVKPQHERWLAEQAVKEEVNQ